VFVTQNGVFEDTWFGPSPLYVQFRDLHYVCNEQLSTIRKVWDGSTLKLSLMRNFTLALMEKWFELKQSVSSVSLMDDCDSIIWKYARNGQHSTCSLHIIASCRGVIHVFDFAFRSLVRQPLIICSLSVL
jgi:hypothetical protein